MARPWRLVFPETLYHLTDRGNAQQDTFLDAMDRDAFLAILGQDIDQHGWNCYAYCLMDNHYHMLIDTPETNLVAGMQGLNSKSAQRFNHHHQRVGHLFQGRYQSMFVDREHLQNRSARPDSRPRRRTRARRHPRQHGCARLDGHRAPLPRMVPGASRGARQRAGAAPRYSHAPPGHTRRAGCNVPVSGL